MDGLSSSTPAAEKAKILEEEHQPGLQEEIISSFGNLQLNNTSMSSIKALTSRKGLAKDRKSIMRVRASGSTTKERGRKPQNKSEKQSYTTGKSSRKGRPKFGNQEITLVSTQVIELDEGDVSESKEKDGCCSDDDELPDIDDVPIFTVTAVAAPRNEGGASSKPSSRPSKPVMVESNGSKSLDAVCKAYAKSEVKDTKMVAAKKLTKKLNKSAFSSLASYDAEERRYFSRDGGFVVKTEDVVDSNGQFHVWMIQREPKLLQRFDPVTIGNRNYHCAANVYAPFTALNLEFHKKYRPVMFDVVLNTREWTVGIHYNVQPSMPLPRAQLCEDYVSYLKFITLRAMTDDDRMETLLKSAAKAKFEAGLVAIEKHIKSILSPLDSLRCCRDVMLRIRHFPTFTTSLDVRRKSLCVFCSRGVGSNTKAVTKVTVHGDCYDPESLCRGHPGQEPCPLSPDYLLCCDCVSNFSALHRLVHYKFYTFITVRYLLLQEYQSLQPGQTYSAERLYRYVTGDGRWMKEMFYEFQAISANASRAVRRIKVVAKVSRR